ncbi:MAG: AAA family ATPase [bacterium]
MLKSLEIERLRGIRQGRIENFAPLSVLVGQNGSGKSTVLDALLIAGSQQIGPAIGQAVQRRTTLDFAAPWLLWRGGGSDEPARVTLGTEQRTFWIEIRRGMRATNQDELLVTVDAAIKGSHLLITFVRGNAFTPMNSQAYASSSPVAFIRLIEATRGERLDRLLTEAIKAGRRRAVESLLGEIIPGLVSVQMLTDKAGSPEVHFEFDWGSVPVALAGDGLHALTRLVYELATPQDALLLIEEPEVHMHPRALDAAARAMVETVKRGNQIVVSTHSLDLIDDLIRAADTTGMLDQLAVFRTAIVDGELRTSRFPGEEAQFARDQIEEDLR